MVRNLTVKPQADGCGKIARPAFGQRPSDAVCHERIDLRDGPARPARLTLKAEAGLARDAGRCGVLGMDERDEAPAAEDILRMIADGCDRLARIAATPYRRYHDIDELDLRPTIDLLLEEAAMSDDGAAALGDHGPEREGRIGTEIVAQQAADFAEIAGAAEMARG